MNEQRPLAGAAKNKMYDVIVVGARCAGSPLAMQLARKGHRVALVDRAAFPSDTLSTHFIQQPGMVRLKQWGVLDRVMATGCPPITGGRLDIDGQPIEAEFPAPGGIPGNAAPRRTVLDKVLVDAAVEAGAELHDKTFVDSLIFEDGRVAGMKAHSDEGEIDLKARFVIGADGRNSSVGSEVESEYIEFTPALGNGYYSYWSDVETKGAEISLYERFSTVAFPTNDGLTTIAWVVPPEDFEELRKDREGNSLALFDRIEGFGERVRKGDPAEKISVSRTCRASCAVHGDRVGRSSATRSITRTRRRRMASRTRSAERTSSARD